MIETGFSKSEEAGLAMVPENALNIYSVGMSTGGTAEIRMAHLRPAARVTATTLDEQGLNFAIQRVKDEDLEDRITLKIEDVSGALSYDDAKFDYVYARLVLHYLPKYQLAAALQNLRRILKPGGILFVVVRSTKCPDATREGAKYDPTTGMTICTVNENGKTYSYARYFHTEESITEALQQAGFAVDSVQSYPEQLYKDFMRTELAAKPDQVIQVEATTERSR